jgi:hypothetical protein
MPKKQTKSEELPRWAKTKIRKISRLSGISESMILEMVIHFGLYQVKEQLTPVMNLMESARHLEDEDKEPGEIEPGPVEPSGLVSLDVELPPVEERPDNVIERRDEFEESNQDNDLLAALSGE